MKQTLDYQTVQRRSEPQTDKHLTQSQGDVVAQKKTNQTGMPDNLKSGIESLSGVDMSDVKVHYNSDKPAQLQAHAYAQGSDIHIASGQEKHLGHEAWHVVQQKQGRVQPTTQMKGTKVNDDSSLEREADVMGAKAVQMKADTSQTNNLRTTPAKGNVLQGFFGWLTSCFGGGKEEKSDEQKAMESIKNVRRGNGKNDILATKGESYGKLSFMRQYGNEIKKELLKVLISEGQDANEALQLVQSGRVDAYIATVLQTGNCGEFANMIYWHFMENTTGKSIYRVSMAPRKEDQDAPSDSSSYVDAVTGLTHPRPTESRYFDHAFNIVSPSDKGTNPNPQDLVDDKNTMVVDGWGDRDKGDGKTLAKFMAGSNPYGAMLKAHNLRIRLGGLSDKKSRLSKDIKTKIEKITLEVYNAKKQPHLDKGTKVYDELDKGNKVSGVFNL